MGPLRRPLLVVGFAVAVMLLTAVGPTGGHADLANENCADATPANQLEQLLQVTGRTPGWSRAHWAIESARETTVWLKPATRVPLV